MCRVATYLATVLVMGTCVATARAQGPQYNRSIELVEVIEGADGLEQVFVRVGIYATGFVVLNYDLTVLINGVPQTFPHDLTYNGAADGCSTGDACSGCSAGYSCFVGVPGAGCKCGRFAYTATMPFPIEPGSVVEAFLAPARGGYPEIDTSDDAHFQIYDGSPVHWNRRISNVQVTPAAVGGDSFFDIVFDLSVETDNVGNELDLSTDLDVLVNGRRVHTQRWLVNTTPGGPNGCGIGCATFQACTCVQTPWGETVCYCGGFVANCNGGTHELQPGDEITVLLRPAPNALPELPGLEGDDEEEATPPRTCGDFDGDGDTDLEDFANFQLCYNGPGNPPAPSCLVGFAADCDGDGDVDLVDYSTFQANFTGSQ